MAIVVVDYISLLMLAVLVGVANFFHG